MVKLLFAVFFILIVPLTVITASANHDDIGNHPSHMPIPFYQDTYIWETDHVRYEIPYKAYPDTVTNISVLQDSASIIVDINETFYERPFMIDLSFALYENNDGTDFFVLADGEEIDVKETMLKNYTHLEILIPPNIKQIEIIQAFIPELSPLPKSFQIIHDPPYSYILPPLKKLEHIDDIHKIVCKDHQQLIFKKDVWSPACINEDSVSKLIKRGWAAEHNPTHMDMMMTTYNKTIKDKWTAEYDKSEKTGHAATGWNSILLRNGDNFYCNPSDNVTPEQCFSLETIVFGNARKDWTVYPGGAGWIPLNNSTLLRVYNEVGFGVPSLNFTAMLNDEIFVNKCELNGGVWNYTYHDCEALWQVCRDVGGIMIQEDITPPCTDTGIIDDEPLTIKVCHGAEIIRVSCIFEYEN